MFMQAQCGNIRVKEVRHGLMAYYPHDEYVGKSFDVYGEFSPQERDFILSVVQPGWTVLDIGANIGALTIPLAQKCRQVIAFEPQPALCRLLAANVALNELENVNPWCAAVGSDHRQITLPAIDYSQPGNFGGVEMQPAHAPGILVDQFTLCGIDVPAHFIKIDVEGMELEVLKGGKPYLMQWRPLLYVEDDRADKSEALHKYLVEELNYRIYRHDTPLFSPNNFAGNEENVWGADLWSFNIFCVPAESAPEVEHAA